MKKSKIASNICWIFLALILCCSSITVSFAHENETIEHKEQILISDEQFIDNFNKGIDSYNFFMGLMKNPINKTSTYSSNKDTQNIYSDMYAGAYIDNNGIINLCSTIDTEISANISKSIETNDVNYRIMKYSYNELQKLADAIFAKSDIFSITEVAIKQSENKVHAFYSDRNKLKNIKEFVSQMNYPEDSVKYFYKEAAVQQKKAYAGDEIYYRAGFLGLGGRYSGTIGAHVIDNRTGEVGVLTNAHVAPSGEKMKHRDGTIGTTTKIQFGGTCDAAFVAYDNPSKWTITKHASANNGESYYGNTAYSDSETWTMEGMRIKKLGITTGETEGTILYNSVSANITDDNGATTHYTDLIHHSNPSDSGDSGGPIYAIGGPKGHLWFIGIHTAGWFSGSSGFACKATNIFDALDISFYS